MFAKVALTLAPLLSGSLAPTAEASFDQLESFSLSVAGEDPRASVVEPQAGVLFASARSASSVPPSSLEKIKVEEIGLIVAAYERGVKRTDEELAMLAQKLTGLFALGDWNPPQNGSSSKVHRDHESGRVTFDNVGKSNGHATHEIRAVAYDFLIQLSLFERLPQDEIKDLVGYMLACSDGNPGVNTDGTQGIFRLTPTQFSEICLPLVKSWGKKVGSNTELPKEWKGDALETTALIQDVLTQSLGVVSLYLEARHEVKSSDKRGENAPGFKDTVWKTFAGKLAVAELLDDRARESKELAEEFSLRKKEISTNLKGKERADALKSLELEQEEAQLTLATLMEQRTIDEEKRSLDRLAAGKRQLAANGAAGKPRSEAFDFYIERLRMNGQ